MQENKYRKPNIKLQRMGATCVKWIAPLAFNLNAMMKKLAMESSWLSKRMKAVRFSFINLPGRVVKRSRSLIIRLTKNNPAMELLINAREKIAMLQSVPSG